MEADYNSAAQNDVLPGRAYASLGQNAAQAQRQRTLSGIGAASSRATGLRVRLQEMLDRVSPVPRAVSGQDAAKTANPLVPSYAHSLSRLQDELAEISQIIDDLESHI